MSVTLNAGQQAAADGFFDFLLGPDQEFNLSGPGGVGKTFLMGYLIDQIMPRYHEICRIAGETPQFREVAMTATTNKAAEVLGKATRRPTSTVHSLLGLIVKDDYDTGVSRVARGKNWKVHANKIIFVDEASMIDAALLQHIREGTIHCKIVYVGDHCQLAPVTEQISPIYRQGLPFFELTEQMRNQGQPALMDVCAQLRETVETGVFRPIRTVPGVIDLLDDRAMEREIDTHFLDPNNHDRILAYTNKRVLEYNDHIRTLRGLPRGPAAGEFVINNSAILLSGGMASVEDEYEIVHVAEASSAVTLEPGVELEVVSCDLRGEHALHTNVPVPVDKDHFVQLVRYYARQKNWPRYYHLKNTFPDLRPRDAATVHKAQGSTYETVFVDLADLSTCRNPQMAARLLYVAFSRARRRVVLYGRLTPKFGGTVP